MGAIGARSAFPGHRSDVCRALGGEKWGEGAGVDLAGQGLALGMVGHRPYCGPAGAGLQKIS